MRISKKIDTGRVILIETVSKSRGSIEFKKIIGVSEEKYNSAYKDKYKKETNRIPEGAEAPISLRLTNLFPITVYHLLVKMSIGIFRQIQKWAHTLSPLCLRRGSVQV